MYPNLARKLYFIPRILTFSSLILPISSGGRVICWRGFQDFSQHEHAQIRTIVGITLPSDADASDPEAGMQITSGEIVVLN